MTEAPAAGASILELLREGSRVLRGHARLFVLLMGVPMLAQLVAVLLMVFFIVPMRPGRSLREVWLLMDDGRKFAVSVLFLAILAFVYRALAASVFAAAEIHNGRSVSVWQALGHVRQTVAALLADLVDWLPRCSDGPARSFHRTGFRFRLRTHVASGDSGRPRRDQSTAAWRRACEGRPGKAHVGFPHVPGTGRCRRVRVEAFVRLQQIFGNPWYL